MDCLTSYCVKKDSVPPIFSMETQRLIEAENIQVPQVFIDLSRRNTYRTVHLSLKDIEYSRTPFRCCFGCSFLFLAIFITCLATEVLNVNKYSISITVIAGVFFVIFTYCLCCCDLPDEDEKDHPLLDVSVDRTDKGHIRHFLSNHYFGLKGQFTTVIKKINKIKNQTHRLPTVAEEREIASLFLYEKAIEELEAIFQYYQTKSLSSSSSSQDSSSIDIDL